MKALIVSDALQDGKNIQTALEEAGYDTICYRWLLKALDNVEEIQPHLVIINAVDYPRHWKLMVQHMRCSLKNQPKVILLVPIDFEDEEAEKAELLDVRGCITGTGKKSLERLHQLLGVQGAFITIPPSKAKIVFLHPHEEVLCSGQLNECGEDLYRLVTDRPVELQTGDLITDGSIKTSEGIKSIQAEVVETDPKMVLSVN